MVDARLLSAQQQEAIKSYLGHSAGAVLDEELVEAADLLSSMAGYVSSFIKDKTQTICTLYYSKYCIPHLCRTCSDKGTAAVAETSMWRYFNKFLEAFPVSPQGQPPSKRQRSEAGFPEARSFYDKWRASQYTKRADYLVGKSPNLSIQHWHP